MKKLIIAGILVASSSAFAGEPYELDIPSLGEQAKAAEESQFQDVLQTLRADPDYAGTYSELTLRGQHYIVDRRMEPVTKQPGAQPSGAARIAGFVNSLSAEARGSVRISVSYTFNADGSIASENWNMDFSGSWKSNASMNEAMGKQHK